MPFIIGNIDKDAKETGVWKEFKDGGEFKIVHMSSEQFIKAREEADKLEDEADRNKVLAKALVVDWKGVVDLEGNDIKFDSDLVADEMDQNDAFKYFIFNTATQDEDYRRVKELKKVEKVKKPSNGS